MKRFGHLWTQVTAWENLVQAARQAQRGKRFRDNVLPFNYHLEAELLQLQSELISRTYQPGAYKTFHIVEPKRRMVSAAPTVAPFSKEIRARAIGTAPID